MKITRHHILWFCLINVVKGLMTAFNELLLAVFNAITTYGLKVTIKEEQQLQEKMRVKKLKPPINSQPVMYEVYFMILILSKTIQ